MRSFSLPSSLPISVFMSLPLCALLAGCIYEKGTVVQYVEAPYTPDEPSCEESSYDVGLSEVTALGFAASDVVALLAGPREAELVYADGHSTTVTLSAAHDGGAVTYTHRTSVDGTTDCTDDLTVGVELSLLTSDGAFDELLPFEVSLSELGLGINPSLIQPIDELGGSFSLAAADELNYILFFGTDGSFDGEIVAIDFADDPEDAMRECGVGAWNIDLATGCW